MLGWIHLATLGLDTASISDWWFDEVERWHPSGGLPARSLLGPYLGGLVLALAALETLPGWLGLGPRRSLDPAGLACPAREIPLRIFKLFT